MKARITAALTVAALTTVIAAPAAHAAPGGDLTKQSIDDYVNQALETTGVPGISMVVTHDDEIVHAAGYGHDGNGDAMTADTPIRLASVTKSFTGMAVMILVEDGEIELDEPVADQLPGFTMADPRADAITVRHLLNQTSGLSDTTVDITDLEEATSPSDYVSRLKDGRLAADPGQNWEYCNVNFDVAARLVEHASGTSFDAFMQQRVFAPLGMDDSSMRPSEVKLPNGYNSLYGLWLSRAEADGFHDDSGAGGLVSTAADMGRWLITQQGEGEQLISADGLTASHTPSTVHEYGFGWGVEGDRLVHSGNLMTYNAVEIVDTETGYGVAVMSNGAGMVDAAYSVGEGLMALTEGKRPAAPPSDSVTQLALAGLALLALGLGVMGVLRAKRWAGKRTGRPAWRVGLRLLPLAMPIVLFAAYPELVEILVNGRTVTWAQLTYFAIPLTVTLAIAALASAGTMATRLVRLVRSHRHAQ